LPRLSGDYPDSLRILSADRSIIREAYPAYPPQVCQYCIYVDQVSLESVLRANDLSNQQLITPYVVIIRLDWSLSDLENFDWEDEGSDLEENDPLDEGYPPVEGFKLKDVGWMKALPREIVILYQSLHDDGWHTSYLRPSGVLGAAPVVEQLGSVLE
jgi:hypothetical protein